MKLMEACMHGNNDVHILNHQSKIPKSTAIKLLNPNQTACNIIISF
jgi:hypothetical protein